MKAPVYGASFWQRLMNSTDDGDNDDNAGSVKQNNVTVVAPTLPSESHTYAQK